MKMSCYLMLRLFSYRRNIVYAFTPSGIWLKMDFTEQDVITAVVGKSRILEDYPEESRCLIVGYFHLT
jgi:hypothetical protein